MTVAARCGRASPGGTASGARSRTIVLEQLDLTGKAIDLSGRKAMVVGAEHPAAGAIARAYAAAGADVALCVLTADDAVLRARAVRRDIEAMGRRAIEYVMDVTLGKNVEVTTRQVVKELGGLDIVASAPDLFLARPIARITNSELARVLAVNFSSQFFVVRAVVEEFRRARRPGRIVLVTSVLGERAVADVTAYAAAHGAVRSLVRAAALEVAGEGITVNAIALGWMEGMDGRIDPDDPHAQRAGRPEDVGPLAVYLSSETAAGDVTGQVFTIDGGLPPHQ
ncbi:MAG: SDR family oxidoreductase [Dehalococcoidia bacterium]|nr:SDR family oxidoreductase [Dehalococcoidia bacterium]